MKVLLAIFAITMVLGLAGCANEDLPDDYEMPCTSDGCDDNA